MKVLQVIPGIAPRYGGPSQAVVSIARVLEASGVTSLIATTDADGPGQLSVALEQPTLYEGVPTIFFHRQISEAFKVSLPLARWLRQHVREFDLVHIHAVFSYSSWAAAQACLSHDVPYIVRPLGTLDQWSRAQKPIRKWLMWHATARAFLQRAAAIHYTSAEEQRDVEGHLGLSRGVVIPLGIPDLGSPNPENEQRVRHRFPELGERPYVLVLSRLHPVKRLEVLIDAFREVTQTPELSAWRLVIAGTGDPAYEQALQAKAGNGVLFTGWIGGADKQGALDGAALFALTSQHENFGVAVAEALLRGVPVLVSDHVNLAAEVMSAGAGWVTGLDQTSVAGALREALVDADERRRRGAAARELAQERYTGQRTGTALVRLYESIKS